MPEYLLEIISTRGRMSIENFNSAFTGLLPRMLAPSREEVDIGVLRLQAARLLEALGHCEFDYERRQVLACPPTLVTVPGAGPPKGVLAGARSPAIVKKLRKFAAEHRDSISISCEPQKYGPLGLPAAIYVTAASHEPLCEAADFASLEYQNLPASWTLANFSPSLEEVKQSLHYQDRESPNWPSQVFSPFTLTFSATKPDVGNLKMISYINPVDRQRLHWLWDENQAASVDRDWGRYLVLAAHGASVLLYDKARRRLAVPQTAPLPRFLARAATLCAGRAPSPANLGGKAAGIVPQNRPFDVYQAVPPPISGLIAERLSQQAVPYRIEPGTSGELQ